MHRLEVGDDDYPPWLRTIPDRPPVVYVRGRLPRGLRCVACVGTRVPSSFGCAAARGVAGFLAARGWSVVSGLALGVDTIAHEAALAASGHTVAVLANGLDRVHPRQNEPLAARILAAGGALLSEQPPGTAALPRHLVARNRIQSGMSTATAVMQTDLVGGTMHTARYTLLQGRLLVAAVPAGSHAGEPKSRGLLALTQRTGTDLVRLLEARGSLAELLLREFADRPVAQQLRGRGDYDTLVAELEVAINSARRPQSEASSVLAATPPAIQLRLAF